MSVSFGDSSDAFLSQLEIRRRYSQAFLVRPLGRVLTNCHLVPLKVLQAQFLIVLEITVPTYRPNPTQDLPLMTNLMAIFANKPAVLQG
jgi:hypothetical protein